MSLTHAERPRRLISLHLYEDQLAVLDERARAAERSRAAEVRLLVDAALSEPSTDEAQGDPAIRPAA